MKLNRDHRITPKSREVENYVNKMDYDVKFSVREVLDSLNVDKHTVSNTMGRLFHKGILAREPKPEHTNQFNYWKPGRKTDLFYKAMKSLSLCYKPDEYRGVA